MNMTLLNMRSGENCRLNVFSIILRSGSMPLSEMNSGYHRIKKIKKYIFF